MLEVANVIEADLCHLHTIAGLSIYDPRWEEFGNKDVAPERLERLLVHLTGRPVVMRRKEAGVVRGADLHGAHLMALDISTGTPEAAVLRSAFQGISMDGFQRMESRVMRDCLEHAAANTGVATPNLLARLLQLQPTRQPAP